MSKKKTLLALIYLLPLLVMSHPIKMSMLYVEYKPESKSLVVECRLFGDDLTVAIEEEMGRKINLGYWGDTEQELVNSFIEKHVNIRFGSRVCNLQFYDYEYNRSNNLVTLRYEFNAIALQVGDKVVLTNSLFFKQFSYMQTNILQIQIPKVAETTVECSMNDYTKTYIVKK